MNWDPVELYQEAFDLRDEDLQPGEREKIVAQEQLFTSDRGRFEILPSECALIVVDMQNHFVHPDSQFRCFEATREVPRIKALIEACREAGVPVVYTQATFDPDVDRPFRMRLGNRENHLRPGTWGAQIVDDLTPLPGERVVSTKHTYDAFEGTDLDYVLRYREVRAVIICGTNTDRCCESTARRAFSLHYQVVFGSDVNSTDSGWQQTATLRSMRFGLARVATSEQIIAELRRNAGRGANPARTVAPPAAGQPVGEKA